MQRVTVMNQISREKKEILLPDLRAGSISLFNDTRIVDGSQNIIGGTETVFQLIPEGFLRISTNVRLKSGERATGTYIPTDSPVYETLIRGDDFYGRAYVVNEWYMTAYSPIKNPAGKVVGAIYYGIPEARVHKKLLEMLEKIRLGETGYLAIIDNEGDYVLSYKRERDGENILKVTDNDGRLVIKEMIDLAKQAKPGEIFEYRYSWKNQEDNRARRKMAYVTYYAPWKWTILMTAYEDETYAVLSGITYTFLLVIVSVVIIGLAISIVFGRSMMGPIQKMTGYITTMTQGNISFQMDPAIYKRGDEVSQMGKELELFLARIREIVTTIKKLTGEVSVTSSDLDLITGSVSANIQSQSASVEEISAAVEELAASMESISNHAKQQKQETTDLSQNIERQSRAIGEVGGRIDQAARLSLDLSSSVEKGESSLKDLKKSMDELVGSSHKMAGITDIITGISEQINLLSLNASIEAARAGDSGRGFAVVASEVSRLAEQTGSSINEIVNLIQINETEISEGSVSTDRTIQVMAEVILGIGKIEAMMRAVAGEMGSQLEINRSVTERSTNVLQSATEVQETTESHRRATDEISSSLQEVNSLIQKISLEFEPISTRAQGLGRMAKDLQENIDYFQLK